MSCDPERITGCVDGALDDAARAAVEEHLASCPTCRDQVAAEREIRSRLRGLRSIQPREGFEDELRRRLAKRPAGGRARWLLPMAAGLTLLALWVRGAAPFVAFELARDHAHCFSFPRLPAEVWSGDPARVAAWFEGQGTRLPEIPAAAGGLELVGGRFCPLLDGSKVAHLYYVGEDRRLSVFVVGHGVRLSGSYSGAARGASVNLVRVGDATVGLVSERPGAVEAFRRAFTTAVALRADVDRPQRSW